jgi:anthranilate synthase component 1
MQILDELEPTRRGPYGGGIGHVSFTGGMDMALALRTMVIPTGGSIDYLYDYHHQPKARREWTVHIQASSLPPDLAILVFGFLCLPCRDTIQSPV